MAVSNLFRSVLTLILLVALSCIAHAQEGDEEYDPEDQLPYVGLGAGYSPIFSFMNLDKLNEVNRELKVEEFKGPLVLHSGNFMISPSMFPNWRLGGYGAGGYKVTSSQVILDGETYRRAVSFTVGHGGVMVNRAIRITPSFTILPGAIAALGTYAYAFAQTREGGNEFPGIVSDSALAGKARGLNRYGRFLALHVFLHPVVYAEYALTGSIMVRLGAGYSISTRLGSWTDLAEADIDKFPDFKADGPTVHLGIFFGLFQE
jgi:hypothetical protein